MRTILQTPPVPMVVPAGVFDAFGWCTSRSLEWIGPAGFCANGRVLADNPARMVFLFRHDVPFLPGELASLHVPGLDVGDAFALAPYGIDDATDELFAHGLPPDDALLLATDSLAGLFWGLHDWAHFHNHGPFTERAWTELQCDAASLAWLWCNRAKIGLTKEEWSAIHADVTAIGEARFVDEGLTVRGARLDARRIQSWSEASARAQ